MSDRPATRRRLLLTCISQSMCWDPEALVEGSADRPLSGSSAFVNCVAILFCADLPDSRDAARCGLNGFGRERGAPRIDAPGSFLDFDRKRTRSFPKSPSRRSALLAADVQRRGGQRLRWARIRIRCTSPRDCWGRRTKTLACSRRSRQSNQIDFRRRGASSLRTSLLPAALQYAVELLEDRVYDT